MSLLSSLTMPPENTWNFCQFIRNGLGSSGVERWGFPDQPWWSHGPGLNATHSLSHCNHQPPTPTSLKLEIQVHKSDLGISDLVTPFESAGASRWWSWPLLEETTYPWHKEPHGVSCGFHRVDRKEPVNCMAHHACSCFAYLSPQGAPGLLCLWTFPFWPCPLESSNSSHSCLSGLKE